MTIQLCHINKWVTSNLQLVTQANKREKTQISMFNSYEAVDATWLNKYSYVYVVTWGLPYCLVLYKPYMSAL